MRIREQGITLRKQSATTCSPVAASPGGWSPGQPGSRCLSVGRTQPRLCGVPLASLARVLGTSLPAGSTLATHDPWAAEGAAFRALTAGAGRPGAAPALRAASALERGHPGRRAVRPSPPVPAPRSPPERGEETRAPGAAGTGDCWLCIGAPGLPGRGGHLLPGPGAACQALPAEAHPSGPGSPGQPLSAAPDGPGSPRRAAAGLGKPFPGPPRPRACSHARTYGHPPSAGDRASELPPARAETQAK